MAQRAATGAFPPERNHLAAHITLFHHLPGERLAEIEVHLKMTASRQYEFRLNFRAVKFTGRSIMVEIASPLLISLKNKLTNHWNDWLTPQNRQRFAPHVTIQNKVAPEEAAKLYRRVKRRVAAASRHGDRAAAVVLPKRTVAVRQRIRLLPNRQSVTKHGRMRIIKSVELKEFELKSVANTVARIES